MRLIRQLTSKLGLGCTHATGPLRALVALTSVGVMAGLGTVATGAVPAIAAQDQDHEKNVKIEVKKIQSDDGENVEVVIVGEGGMDHKALLKKLKSTHGIDVMQIHGDQGHEVEVVVIGDDDSEHQGLLKKLKSRKHTIDVKKIKGDHQDDVEVILLDGDQGIAKVHEKVRGHVAEFLLKKGSATSNHHELANQLRAIANQLDGQAHAEHQNVQLHEDVELHDSGDHGIHILKHGKSDKKNNRNVEVVTGGGKRLHIVNSDQPQKMIVDLAPEFENLVHAAHDKNKKVWLRRTEDHGSAHEIVVKEIHGDHDSHQDADDHHPSHGKTSAESGVSTLEDLRAELEALRKDLQQLRAKRKPQQKKVWLKKAQSSAKDGTENRFVWFSGDEEIKSGNRFVWKQNEGEAKEVSPNRFRFEIQKDDDDTENSGDDNE